MLAYLQGDIGRDHPQDSVLVQYLHPQGEPGGFWEGKRDCICSVFHGRGTPTDTPRGSPRSRIQPVKAWKSTQLGNKCMPLGFRAPLAHVTQATPLLCLHLEEGFSFHKAQEGSSEGKYLPPKQSRAVKVEFELTFLRRQKRGGEGGWEKKKDDEGEKRQRSIKRCKV